jgi:AcrR family transcriptional regulator
MRGAKASAKIRKKQIIIAAMRCFQRKGYVNTTVDDIAAEYGLSKGSIYWYYSSKKAVLIDIFQYWMDETFQGISVEIDNLETSRDKLIRMGEFFIESLIKDLELYSSLMVFWGTAFEDDTMRQMIRGLYRKYDEMVTSLLYQGESSGEFTAPNKKIFSTLLIAMIEGLIVRQVMVNSLDLSGIRQEIRVVVNRLLPQQ